MPNYYQLALAIRAMREEIEIEVTGPFDSPSKDFKQVESEMKDVLRIEGWSENEILLGGFLNLWSDVGSDDETQQ